MSKRKNWIAYCALTVLAVALFALCIWLSNYLQVLGARRYNYTPFMIVTVICFPVLWGLLLAVRSRCYRKVIDKAASLIPEILLILLGMTAALCIALQGSLSVSLMIPILPYMAIFPAMFVGIALTDIAAGIGQIRKKKTEPVIQEENE